MSHNASLLLIGLIAVAALVVLVARFKINSFVALMLASLFVGLCSGMKPAAVPKSFLEGMGRVLGDIAMVIGLGTVVAPRPFKPWRRDRPNAGGERRR